MNTNIIAIILQEGGKIVSEIIRTRQPKRRITEAMPSPAELEYEVVSEGRSEGEKATSIEAGCVPCAIGHLGTCSGLLAESLRFAKKDGIESNEVISRVNLCLDELNSLERVDLRPELIVNLSEWEKELANKAQTESRNARHNLEGLSTTEDLEKVAADIQSTRQSIGKEWFKRRLKNMSREQKEQLSQKAIEKLEEGANE